MVNQGYVDIDLYGRGFDGIFGPGAENENRRQALMRFQAMKRFKERVKPGEYIDLDLYGRGDPRIFGRDSHIHTQNEAQKHLEEGQRRKEERKIHPLFVVFPSGIKAIKRYARELLHRRSSLRKRDSQEDVNDVVEVDDDHNTAHKVPQNVERSVSEGAQSTSDIPEPLEETSVEAVDRTPKRVKSKLPSEEARPHVEKGHVLRAIKSFSSFEKVENRTTVPGNVVLAELARLEKYSSLPIRATRLTEPSGFSSNMDTRNEIKDRGETNEASNTGDEIAKRILDGSDEEFQLSFSAPQTVVVRAFSGSPSTSSEEDLVARETRVEHIVLDGAGRTLAGSNKIKELFRSGDMGSDYGSEPGEAGDERRVPEDDSRVPEDDSRVPEDDSRVPEDDSRVLEDDSRLPGETKYTSLTSSSTENEALSENIVPVTGLSLHDLQVGEDDYFSADQAVPEQDNIIGTDSRGDSIIRFIETPDISFNDHNQFDLQDDFEEAPNDKEARGASIHDADARDSGTKETIDHNAETIVDKGTSSRNASSSTAEYENGEFVEDAGNEQGSESAQASESAQDSESMADSDRSAEVDSSSEVMTSSPEEDGDDIDRDSSEAETGVELVEDIAEVDDNEEFEVVESEAREVSDRGTVESSDDDSSGDDAEGETVENDHSHGEDNAGDDNNNDADDTPPDEQDNRTFWQRLGLFGAVITNNTWKMF